jgi:hypothetical protein
MKKLIVAVIGIAFLGSCSTNKYGCPYTYEVKEIQTETFIDIADCNDSVTDCQQTMSVTR